MDKVDWILNAILALNVVVSLWGAKYTTTVRAQIKAVNPAALIVVGLNGWAIRGLWIWLAVEMDRWQFAAIALVSWLIGTAAGRVKP